MFPYCIANLLIQTSKSNGFLNFGINPRFVLGKPSLGLCKIYLLYHLQLLDGRLPDAPRLSITISYLLLAFAFHKGLFELVVYQRNGGRLKQRALADCMVPRGTNPSGVASTLESLH